MLTKNTIEEDTKVQNSMGKDMEPEHSTIARVANMLAVGNKTKCMVEEFFIIQINKSHMMENGRMTSYQDMELYTTNKYHL